MSPNVDAAADTNTTINFPFTLNDLDYFIMVRQDGTAVKMTLDRMREEEGTHRMDYGSGAMTGVGKAKSLSSYCNHNPSKLPVYLTPDGKVGIWIADGWGTKQHKDEFDLVIDGGNVLTIPSKAVYVPTVVRKMDGDEELVKLGKEYEIQPPPPAPYSGPSILQITWYDREAPPLTPAWWSVLAQTLATRTSRFVDSPYRVLVNCQGGHGRSGTSLVCLMMAYTNYTALEAITHLRAVHCPRAIESTKQHDYINLVATEMGREANAHDAAKIASYQEVFGKSTHPVAVATRKRLNWA